jgi:hypothetical protein
MTFKKLTSDFVVSAQIVESEWLAKPEPIKAAG